MTFLVDDVDLHHNFFLLCCAVENLILLFCEQQLETSKLCRCLLDAAFFCVQLMGTLCCCNNEINRAARSQPFAHPLHIRCDMGNCDAPSLGAATGPSAPPVLCFYLCAAICLAPLLAPAADGNSQICAWLRRRSTKSHYIYTSCSSEMFR